MRTSFLLLFTILAFTSFAQLPSRERIQFTPKVYYREFTTAAIPALEINEYDTVVTESVDAGGFDKTGVRVTERGNPLTGPFSIKGAEPGDVLAITITSVALNRNYATTLNAFIPKMLPKKTGMRAWRSAKLVKWALDTIGMTGQPDPRFEKLKGMSIPLHPFIGCVGIAPEGEKGASSGASGPYGGNLDFKYITTGATVYLPVFHTGAMLFLGDGHAVQGDGELNGDALETSMNFSFTVRVIKQAAASLPTPMVEDSIYYMVFGIEKNLDESMKTATMKLSGWLQQEYGFSLQETSQVIGPAVEYRIAKVGATKVEVVAMIRKDVFKNLSKELKSKN